MMITWSRLSQMLFGRTGVSGQPRRSRFSSGKRPTAERTTSLGIDPYRTLELCCMEVPVAAGDGPGLCPGR